MERITKQQLQRTVDRINKIAGQPEDPWTRGEDGKLRANIGNYHLDWAYGGVKLYQMETEGGGCSDILYTGYVSKRELYGQLHAFISGLMAGLEADKEKQS